MTVDELIDKLTPLRGNKVLATWEGAFREIGVYQAKDGTVMVDADGCRYQQALQADFRFPRCHCGADCVVMKEGCAFCQSHTPDED